MTRAELRAALVRRKASDHKGVFGHVLVLAGSRGMAGAAILAARSALRSGAGLVTLALPASLQAAAAAAAPEAMTLGLPENAAGCLTPEGVGLLKKKRFTVLAIGPGLSTHADTVRFVARALAELPWPAVVDADALNALAAQAGPPRRKAPCVFTPHPGEMARCLGVGTAEVLADCEAAAKSLARAWRGVAVLKGHRTVISDGRRAALNRTGGPGLAKGGTGDALTGLIAGLWAQRLASGRGAGEPAFASAALGCWLHGKAGELAERELTPWAMTAQDVVERLPAAFRRLG